MKRTKATDGSGAPCPPDEHSTRPSQRVPSDRALHAVAVMFGAAGDRDRLRLLVELVAGPRTVVALAAAVGKPRSRVSQQLRVLRIGRLVRGVRRGRFVFYELVGPHAQRMLASTLAHARHVQRR